MTTISMRDINQLAGTSTYSIPATVPTDAAALDPAPVGISYEFFTFPSYRYNVTTTEQCERNLRDLTGMWPPIRIGGTTQDRATFDARISTFIIYSVAKPTDAPSTLTFGPAFIDLAAAYPGSVVLGLNRGYDNVTNTIEAAKAAKSQMKNLIAIELGNEPEYYSSQGQAIAKHSGTWNAAADAKSQENWQIQVGNALSQTSIIQACNSLSSPPAWGAEELVKAQNSTALSYVRTFSHHNYPGGSVTQLMSHSRISSNVRSFAEDIKAARSSGKGYVFGETNSVTGGGASSVSPTFGAAVWVADYSLRAASAHVDRLYFHHGTIGACQYCWWGRVAMGTPYYGAHFATVVMAGGSHIVALDSGSSAYGAYATYSSSGKPKRIALLNSDYYSGSGTRGNQTFTLVGLNSAANVTARRLTAQSAEARQDRGQIPTFAGRSFKDGTCVIIGDEVIERVEVVDGRANFMVGASEALVVDF